MSGKLLNRLEVDNEIYLGNLKIFPNYNFNKFQIAQYPLSPSIIYDIEKNNKLKKVFSFNELSNEIIIPAKKYFIIEIIENIILPQNIIGKFIASSNLIEKGIILSVGKIEYPYGNKGEKIRFGLFNCLDVDITLNQKDRIAYIQFVKINYDFKNEYIQTEYDKSIYDSRRKKADDDGPNYEIE